MEMIEYQKYAERTANGGRNGTKLMRFANFGMGLAGEAGETCDMLKKVVFHGHELDKQELCKELGDVMWYVATIATTAGLTLEEIAWKNVEKLKKRYPDGFSEEMSRNREE